MDRQKGGILAVTGKTNIEQGTRKRSLEIKCLLPLRLNHFSDYTENVPSVVPAAAQTGTS